jgi:hypothetical protein
VRFSVVIGMAMTKRLNWQDGIVLTLYILLTLLITWPLPCTMNEVAAGWSSDVYVNLWADWWTAKVVTERLDFYHTDYLFYPQGTSVVFYSFSHTNSLISLALAPMMGRFAAYDLTVLLAFVLSGWGMYLLVRHITNCRPAAFVAGLVFAFQPYHIYESDHPVLFTTQWVPLFALALMRLLHDPSSNRVKQVLRAALWFFLTTLSSWHLMMMLAGWAVLYVIYCVLLERGGLAPKVFRYLFLLAVVVGAGVTPLTWPILSEQLATDASYMAVRAASGVGNDLLSFFTPNALNPWLSPLVTGINARLGPLLRGRSAYLGYGPFALSAVGFITARRKTLFWLLSGVLFFILSLGLHVNLGGEPLHAFPLPWAIPLINIIRHPFRLNVLIFFSLAVLVGFGGSWLYNLVASRSALWARLVLVLVTVLILGEYLVYPFPTYPLSCSPFFYQLAREEGDFAVASFPMGRARDKHSMFCQTIHGKRIVGGVVSRTPYGAYTFASTHPLLGPLLRGNAPDADLDIEEQFSQLAERGIRYIILHKHFLEVDGMRDWRDWLAGFPAPFYEDDWLVAYRTTSTPTYVMKAGMGVIDATLSTETIFPDAVLEARVAWGATIPPGSDLYAELSLIDGEGNVGQVNRFCISPSTGEWPANTIVWDQYAFRVEPWLEEGTYSVALRLARGEDGQPVGQRMIVGEVAMLAPDRSFAAPSVDHRSEAVFGEDLRLLGYGLQVKPDTIRLMLHWQSLRRMKTAYKFFVHLYDTGTGTLVAQADVMPRNWTYPTTWWEAGEFVSDEVLLPVEGIPAGTYRLAVGVYVPATGERLPITGQLSDFTADEGRLILPEEVVR